MGSNPTLKVSQLSLSSVRLERRPKGVVIGSNPMLPLHIKKLRQRGKMTCINKVARERVSFKAGSKRRKLSHNRIRYVSIIKRLGDLPTCLNHQSGRDRREALKKMSP